MGLDDSSTVSLRLDGKKGFRPWAELLPAMCLTGAGFIALGLAWVSPQQSGNQYLLIASPTATRGQTLAIILNAGGRLVSEGRLANIAVASSKAPNFPGQLRKAGAWIAIEAPQNGGCSGELTGVETRS